MSKQILVGSNFNFKNRIINGDFQIWQRGEDITLSKQDGYIGVDRFFTWQKGTDSNGNTAYAVCDVENKKEYDGQDIVSSYYISNTDTTVTNTKFGVTHRVEPINYWNLINKEITISFWIKTNKSTFNFYNWHNYIDSNGNNVGESIYSEDISIQSDKWTKIEKTVTLSSSNYTTIDNEVFTELFAVSMSDIADNDYIQLKQVQVEEGDIATEFERIPYDIQLQRCMRYYEIINESSLTIIKLNSQGNFGGTNKPSIKLIPKRIISTVKVLKYSNSNGNDWDGSLSITKDSISVWTNNLSADTEWCAITVSLDAEL